MERATAIEPAAAERGRGGDPDRGRQQALRRLHRGRRHRPLDPAAASSSRCSGPRGAGRRRRCGCSPASRCRPRAGSCSRASRSRTCRPYERNVNMVFQSYALFGHLDVAGNVAFGLKRKQGPKDEIKQPRRRGARAGRPRQPRGVAPDRALRRSAPAGRAGAGAGQPPGGAAARRAARRARPEAAPADAGRAQADPARGRDHVRLRDPRPGGGALDVGPDRGDERRARSSSAGLPRRSTSTRPRSSSPASSASRTCSRASSTDPARSGSAPGMNGSPPRCRTIAAPATRSSSPSGPRRSPSTMRSRRGWSR